MAIDQDTARALAELRRRSRRTLAIVAVGMLLVIASLAVAVFRLDELRREASSAAAAASNSAELRRIERDDARRDRDAAVTTLRQAGAAIESNNLQLAQRLLVIASSEVRDTTRPVAPRDVVGPQTGPIRIEPTRSPRPQLVFIQFAGSISRDRIVALNRALRDAGWRAQGASGERTEAALAVNQLRYNPRDDVNAARALAAAVDQARIGTRRLELQPLAMIRPGTFEVWISNAEEDDAP